MSENPQYRGVAFYHLLFLVFLVLKLIDKIDWSWWWITAPLWAASVVRLIIAIGDAIKDE